MKKLICIMAAAPLLLSAENVITNVRDNVVNVKDDGSSINSGIDLGDMKGTLVGNGKKATVKRDIAGFDSVNVGGAFVVNVSVSDGAKSGVEISADSNITDCIKSDVKNGCLFLGASKSYSSKNPVTVKITVPSLKGAVVSGACELTLSGTVKAFSADVSGAAKIHASGLDAVNVTVAASGAGVAEVSASGVLTVNGSGAAKVLYKGNPSKIVKELSGVASLENME